MEFHVQFPTETAYLMRPLAVVAANVLVIFFSVLGQMLSESSGQRGYLLVGPEITTASLGIAAGALLDNVAATNGISVSDQMARWLMAVSLCMLFLCWAALHKSRALNIATKQGRSVSARRVLESISLGLPSFVVAIVIVR